MEDIMEDIMESIESCINNLFDINNLFGINNINSLDLGCSQPTLSINGGQNTVYVNYGTIMTFKVCGDPNADFIIQNVGAGGSGEGSGGDVSTFYPYDIIDRGKLDSDGIHISSMPLNKVGTYVFRAGIYCTVADIDYCTKVSNAVMVTVLEAGCVPNYVCKQPLNGYEYDANYCGQPERIASRCKPECGGVGCEGESKSNLLKIGVIVVLVGGSLYLLSSKK